MNRMKKRTAGRIRKGLACAAASMILTAGIMPVPVFAADAPVITIEKPECWRQGAVTLAVTVDAEAMGADFSIAKTEARIGETGAWIDITGSMQVTVSDNCTVYIRVTDTEGSVYEQNRLVSCYDTEKPTLSASLTDGILSITGYDRLSGIASITVNGTDYTELADGSIRIQLTQKNLTTKKLTLTATDAAGNVSGKYTMTNPYYEWAQKQTAEETSAASDDLTTGTDSMSSGSSGQASSGTSTGQVAEITTSPLPQTAEPSAPTEATGTVIDRTEAQTGESVDTVTQTGTEGSKAFYTITTKSGKTFYLIVDNSQSSDNVYLLTEVSEQDLMNFTVSDTVTLPGADTVYAVPEEETEIPETFSDKGLESESESGNETESETESESDDVAMPEDKGGIGSALLIMLIAGTVFAGAWYVKIYKPKHEFDDDDDYENEYEENDLEPVVYEKDDTSPASRSGSDQADDELQEEDGEYWGDDEYNDQADDEKNGREDDRGCN